MSKTFKLSAKMLASLLAFLMILYAIPLEGFAIGSADDYYPDDTYDYIETDENAEKDDPVLILHEEEDLREAESKQYRMSNGTFTTVWYNEALHYEDSDGKWQDIDNTLVVDPEAKGENFYKNIDNDVKYSFEGTPGDGTVFAQLDDYKVSFGFIDETSYSKDKTTDTSIDEFVEPIIDETIAEAAEPEDLESESGTDFAIPDDTVNNESNINEVATVSDEPAETTKDIADSNDPHADESAIITEIEAEATSTVEEEATDPTPASDRSYDIEITNPQGTSPYVSIDKSLEPEENKNADGTVHPYTLDEANARLKVSSEIKYTDRSTGLAFKYNLAGRDLKESIIVNNPAEDYTYKFSFNFENLTPILADDGSIELSDDSGKVIFIIAAPYMFDANDEISFDVKYQIEKNDKGEYVLTVIADPSWINAEDRAFPVTIDPTLYVIGDGTSSTFDIKYRLGTGTIYTNNVVNRMGQNGSTQYLSFMHMSTLPTLPNNCIPVRASVFYRQNAFNKSNNTYSPSEFIIAVREATSASTWYNNPKTNDIMDYQVVKSSTVNSYLTWDITEAVQNWYDDNTTNKGVVFTNETTFNGSYGSYATFYGNNTSSAYLPYIGINYRNTVGVESYYSYLTQDVGRAGMGYVRVNDGKMTFSKGDLSNTGTAQAFTLSHIFNSAYAAYKFVPYTAAGINTLPFSEMNVGYGWKLNIQQTIVDKTISGTDYKIFVDEDGTEHYFYKDPDDATLFKDEDGLGLKIKVNNTTTMTMSDDNDNQKIFKNGYLYQIKDANGNYITIKYGNHANGSAVVGDGIPSTSRHRIVQVTQNIVGENTTKTIATLTYNTNGFLTELTDENSQTTTITYNSDRVTKFTHPDSTEARYTYNSTTGNMTYAYDAEAQYGMSYAYGTYKQVSSFNEFVCTASNFGTTSTYTYGAKYFVGTSGKNKTLIRDTGADRTVDTADDIVTTYLFDTYGRTANTYSSNAKPDDTYAPFRIYGTSVSEYTAMKTAGSNCKANNRISGEALTGSMPINYISNPGAQWDPTNGWTVATGTVYRTGTQHHTGNHSFVLDHTYTSSPNVMMYQTKGLKPGTYTFSAYVKTSFSSTPGSGGAYLTAWNATNGTVKSRVVNETTNEDIENGWERISVSFTITGDSEVFYQISVHLDNVTGVAYFDDFQLEECEGASNANLLNNSTIEDCDTSTPTVATSWITGSGTVERCYDRAMSGGASLKVVSNINTYSIAKTIVDIYDSEVKSSYVISGWAWAKSVPMRSTDTDNDPKFKLYAKLNYHDGTTAYKDAKFNPDIRGEWQYVSLVFVPSKAVDTIEVCCFYANNAGVAYFDNISLIREESQTYKYDDDGNLTKVNSSGVSGDSDFSYQNANLITSTCPGAGTYKYEYKTSGNKHLLEKVKNEMGTTSTTDDFTMEVGHDAAGNTTSSKTYAGTWNASTSTYMSTSATYLGKNYISTQNDANNINTSYAYNAKHEVSGTTVPASETFGGTTATTNYSYYNSGRINMTYMSGVISVTSAYTNGLLSQITRGGYYNGNAAQQYYYFNHDVWGNTTVTKAGSSNLATYTYAANNGNLTTITYGNGATVGYTYDYLDRIKTVSYNNVLKYTYYYDGSGSLYRTVEHDTHNEIFYQYDGIGRLVSQLKYDLSSSTPKRVDAEYFTYDEYSRNSKVITEAGGKTNTATYTYNNNTGDVSTLYNKYDVSTGTNGDRLTYTYDSLNRLSQKKLEHHANTSATLNTNYTFKNVGTSNRTTNQVSQLTYTQATNTTPLYQFNYTYDQAGNIKQVVDESGNTTKYFYDSQNQLAMEEDGANDTTYVYRYDTFGNIRAKETYDVTGFTSLTDVSFVTPISTINYEYTDSNFKDKLTKYNGTTLTYDSIGNPLTWRNGISFTWQNGRELASYSKSGTNISYTYNSDGLRDSKTVNGVTYEYIYNGTQLAYQKWTDANNVARYLRFIYDNEGSPYAVVYNNGTSDEVYYYIKNLQGDVVKIVNKDLIVKVEYTYDAYGKVLTKTGSLAATLGTYNPFRYRSYVYDDETGFYYLGSRYYDPTVGRFINADDVSTVTNGKTITDKNLYAYCDNNPVNRTDDEGDFWNFVVGAIVGAVVSAVSTVAEAVKEDGWGALTSGKTWAKAGVSAVCGVVSGLAAASGIGILGSGVVGAATGYIESYAHQLIDNGGDIKKVSVKKATGAAIVGGISGIIAGKGAIYGNKHMQYEGKRFIKKVAEKGLGYATKLYYKNTAKYSIQFIKPTIKSIFKGFIASKITKRTMAY